MKKFLSILFVILLSGASLLAAGLFDDDPRIHNGNNGNNGNSSSTTTLITEGNGRNIPKGGDVTPDQPQPIVPVIPLSFSPGSPFYGNVVNLGLGFWFDGTPEFMLFFNQSFRTSRNIEFVNLTTGNTYYGVLPAGSTSCWVNVADAIGPWMVRIDNSVAYFTITSEFYNSNLILH